MRVNRTTTPSPPMMRGQIRAGKLLQVATDLFLELGYERTSMDAVIKKAGGSKTTLYRCFPTKADLFRSVVESIVAGQDEPDLDLEDDIRETLQRFAHQRMRVVSSQTHVALVRLIVSEQNRFSRAAGLYWAEGPARRMRILTRYFAKLKHSLRLSIDDPEETASFFNSALMNPWYIRQLILSSATLSEDEMKQHATRTIDRFLKLYLPAEK